MENFWNSEFQLYIFQLLNILIFHIQGEIFCFAPKISFPI